MVFGERVPYNEKISEIIEEELLPELNIEIFVLQYDPLITLEKKRTKYMNKFKTIYLSNFMAHLLPNCLDLLANEGFLIVETAKYKLITKDL